VFSCWNGHAQPTLATGLQKWGGSVVASGLPITSQILLHHQLACAICLALHGALASPTIDGTRRHLSIGEKHGGVLIFYAITQVQSVTRWVEGGVTVVAEAWDSI
jgi:hypothetical protein